MNNTQTIEYNKTTKQITLNSYTDGFLEDSIDITDKVMTLALEKLYDEYGLDLGDELYITKREELKTAKFELKN
ncbi:hypothetical protein [Sulfurimonas sp.]